MPSPKSAKAPSSSGCPRARIAATLWSLTHYPTEKKDWPLARKVAAIAAAGFDGVSGPAYDGLEPELIRHKLPLIGAFDASDSTQFASQLSKFKRLGAKIVNTQVADHDTPTSEALRLTLALLAEAERQDMVVQVECHRDTATETPEKLFALADGYEKATGRLLPITWDHSHLALTKHLKPVDYVGRLLARPELIQASQLFHCRPFNGHHCQVPVRDSRGRMTPEFEDWIAFIEELFRLWLRGPRPGGDVWVVPEIGAHGYSLSVFPRHTWKEAQLCREELAQAWLRAAGARKSP